MHEDNQAMMRVVETGKNPTMRYLGRTHGVSIAWLHETFKGEYLDLAYGTSPRMCADIYMKAFVNAEKFKAVCYLIGVCDPCELEELAKIFRAWETPLPQSGGRTTNTPRNSVGVASGGRASVGQSAANSTGAAMPAAASDAVIPSG